SDFIQGGLRGCTDARPESNLRSAGNPEPCRHGRPKPSTFHGTDQPSTSSATAGTCTAKASEEIKQVLASKSLRRARYSRRSLMRELNSELERVHAELRKIREELDKEPRLLSIQEFIKKLA